MTEESFYAAPTAKLVDDSEDITYSPRILSLSGRLDRSRLFGYAALASIISYLLLFGLFSLIVDGLTGVAIYNKIANFVDMLLLVYILLLIKRRLNDVNVSGWWLFMLLVPLGNLIFILYVMTREGSLGVNKFGAVPSRANLALTLLLVFLAFAVNIGLHFIRPAAFAYY